MKNGFFVFIYILILLGYVALGILSLTGQLSVSPVDMFVSAVALILTVSFAMDIYNNYPLRHCPHCGGSYSGGGYSYEEEERSARTDNEGKVHRTSKIRFAFTCPVCHMERVFRKKMATSAESVEKFANNIVK